MSIAVAVASQDRIVIASDTKASFGSGSVTVENLRSSKIRKVGTAYLAATGWGLYGNILDDYLATTRRRVSLLDERRIFEFFRILWGELHERYSFVKDQRTDEDSPFGDLDASFLVASPKGIFAIAGDMSVTSLAQYFAIGSGGPVAMGAMHALYRNGVDPERVARKAVEAAMDMDIYCGGQVVMHTVRQQARKATRKRARK